ncbi:MAG: hypothetical protein GY896_22835 [Gammaproteobacteria bacterium]|nr:hypothetical protein [Gammaproteobacteria bacterium]
MPTGQYKGKMEELRQAWGGKCLIGFSGCWKDHGLEFAHVKPTKIKRESQNGGKRSGRGLPQRYHDIKNNPGCYLLVCRACHARADGLADEFHNYDLREEAPF